MASDKICSAYKNCETFHGEPACVFSGDSDIAGIGTIVSFMVSSWFSYILVVFAYLFVDDGVSDYRLNSLDRHMIALARGPIKLAGSLFGTRKVAYRFPFTKEAIRTILLTLSDQQLVTGIAVSVVGFSQIRSMAEYHFEVINDLAWLSFTVYQCTAIVLSEKLQESLPPALWRVAWIVCLTGLLAVSTIITYNDHWLESYGTAVQCIWSHVSGGYHDWIFVLILTLFTLFWGAFAAMYGFIPATAPALSVILGPLERALAWIFRLLLSTVNLHAKCFHRRATGSTSTTATLISRFKIISSGALAMFALILVDTARSTALDLLRIWGSGLVFTIFLFKTRASAPSNGLRGGENVWGFGQAVAVFMLLLPLFGVIEVFYDGRKKIDAMQACGLDGFQHKASAADQSEISGEQSHSGSTAALALEWSDRSAVCTTQRIAAQGDLRCPQRQDTEARVGGCVTRTTVAAIIERKGTEASDSDAVAAFRAEYYGKMWFQVLLTIWIVGIYVIFTQLAVMGVAI